MSDKVAGSPKPHWVERAIPVWVALISTVGGIVGGVLVAVITVFAAPLIMDQVLADDAPQSVPFGEQVSGTYELIGPSELLGVGPPIGLNAGTLQISPTGATITIEAYTGELSREPLDGQSGRLDLQCEAILDTGTSPPTLIATHTRQTYATGYASDEQLAYLWNGMCGGIPFTGSVEPMPIQFESFSDGMKSIVLTTPSHKLLWISYPSLE